MVSDGTHSCFGFGIDLADATYGDLYTGPIAEFEGFEGYEYDVSDLDEMLTNGLPDEPSMQENMDGFLYQSTTSPLVFWRRSIDRL